MAAPLALTATQIERGLPKLTASERYVFSRHFREGESFATIGRTWGRSKPTVQTFWERALRKLTAA